MTNSRSQNATYHSEPEYDLDLSGLTPALARAVRERWRMAPVAAHSRHASLKSSCLADPTNDPEEIIRWATIPNLNWCVETGRRSGLLVLEVNHGTGQDLLSELCEDSWDGWLETLKFQDHLSTHFFFRYAGQRVRFLRSQFDGLKIHSGTLLFLHRAGLYQHRPCLLGPECAPARLPGMVLDSRGPDKGARKVIPFPART